LCIYCTIMYTIIKVYKQALGAVLKITVVLMRICRGG